MFSILDTTWRRTCFWQSSSGSSRERVMKSVGRVKQHCDSNSSCTTRRTGTVSLTFWTSASLTNTPTQLHYSRYNDMYDDIINGITVVFYVYCWCVFHPWLFWSYVFIVIVLCFCSWPLSPLVVPSTLSLPLSPPTISIVVFPHLVNS